MRHRDLQPWLDYFKMLREYEQKGFLEVQTEKGEAYITQPALHAMSDGERPEKQLVAIPQTAQRIRAYAAWKSQEGSDYLSKPFALHAVKDLHPHDLLYTILMIRRRKWWKLWRMTDCIEVIRYEDKP